MRQLVSSCGYLKYKQDARRMLVAIGIGLQ